MIDVLEKNSHTYIITTDKKWIFCTLLNDQIQLKHCST